MSSSERFTIQRQFNAIQEDVFRAWSDPSMLKKWWSPASMSCEYMSVDFRVGGVFRYCQVSEDGTRYWGRGEYKVIDEPTKIVYEDCFTDEDGNDVPPSYYGMSGDALDVSTVEVTLEKQDKKTLVTISMNINSSMSSETGQGWQSMFDKLDRVFKEGK